MTKTIFIQQDNAAQGNVVKFRELRVNFFDSMDTVVEIPATMAALSGRVGMKPSEITLEPYGQHDERNGWGNTHIALGKGVPIGFTDGPVAGDTGPGRIYDA